MTKNEDITEKLRYYQNKTYGENDMKLSDIKFECNRCNIHFTPGVIRAQELMDTKGVINECKKCEEGTSDVY